MRILSGSMEIRLWNELWSNISDKKNDFSIVTVDKSYSLMIYVVFENIVFSGTYCTSFDFDKSFFSSFAETRHSFLCNWWFLF